MRRPPRLPRLFASGAIGLILTGVPAAFGQDAPPVERVRVRLVELTLTADDRDGRPVSDLRADDLELTLDGQPVPVANLWRLSPDEPPEALPDVRLGIDGAPEGDPAAVTPGPTRRFFVFVDLENDPPRDRGEALRDVVRVLAERTRPWDLVAIGSYNGSLNLEVPFTADRALVERALRKAFDRPRPKEASSGLRMRKLVRELRSCEYVPDNPFLQTEDERQERTLGFDAIAADEECVRGRQSAYRQERGRAARAYLAALEAAVRYAGGIQGRVSVLAISHGATVDPSQEAADAVRWVFGSSQASQIGEGGGGDESLNRALKRVVSIALAERVTMHFIDASSPRTSLGLAGRSALGTGTNPAETAHLAPRATLQRIAEATGGSVVVDRDLAAGFERAIEAERGRYLLTFYADDAVDVGAAKTRVRSLRAGVRLEHSRALDASSLQREWTPGAVAFGEPRPRSGDRPGTFLPFVVGVRQGEMDYEAKGDEMIANLTLHVRLETLDGRPLVEQHQFLSHRIPAGEWETERDTMLRVRGWFEAPDGHYLLAVVFKNPSTGKKGVVFRDVKVPPDS